MSKDDSFAPRTIDEAESEEIGVTCNLTGMGQ